MTFIRDQFDRRPICISYVQFTNTIQKISGNRQAIGFVVDVSVHARDFRSRHNTVVRSSSFRSAAYFRAFASIMILCLEFIYFPISYAPNRFTFFFFFYFIRPPYSTLISRFLYSRRLSRSDPCGSLPLYSHSVQARV